MNKIMIRYKQLDFDRKDFETQIISIETVDELYRFKTIHQCDTMYTHVQRGLPYDDCRKGRTFSSIWRSSFQCYQKSTL